LWTLAEEQISLPLMTLSKLNKKLQDTLKPIKYWARRQFLNEILVLGDSHSKVFTHQKIRKAIPRHFFTLRYVPGATVSGFQNPKSKTQALPIFRQAIATSRAKITVVLLGEVDTGFVIWYRANKHQTSVTEMLDQALQNYQDLLTEISQKSSVICVSTVLPTINDGQNLGDVAKLRKSVDATQLQRTQLTLTFNQRMREYCESKTFTYLSFDAESLAENGLVREDLLNSNRKDHHYDYAKYADMILPKLKAAILSSQVQMRHRSLPPSHPMAV
jgi:hypothetical protein